jgi:hypothetical protein
MNRLVPLIVPCLIAVMAIVCVAQEGQEPANATVDIVASMMPNGVPTEIVMPSGPEKASSIRKLKAEQAKATGKRAQQIVFLLAILRSEYDKNCSFLVHALEGCDSRPSHDCDEDTAALVIELFNRGDKKLLQPLMKIGLRSDAALSEILGDFYADTLVQRTSDFLDGIQALPSSTQRAVCFLAGGRDGGGMNSEELSDIRKKLRRINNETALRCLSEIEAIN